MACANRPMRGGGANGSEQRSASATVPGGQDGQTCSVVVHRTQAHTRWQREGKLHSLLVGTITPSLLSVNFVLNVGLVFFASAKWKLSKNVIQALRKGLTWATPISSYNRHATNGMSLNCKSPSSLLWPHFTTWWIEDAVFVWDTWHVHRQSFGASSKAQHLNCRQRMRQ